MFKKKKKKSQDNKFKHIKNLYSNHYSIWVLSNKGLIKGTIFLITWYSVLKYVNLPKWYTNKCFYKHIYIYIYEMIYQSLIVRHILFNITIELTSSWDISSESSSPSIKRNRLELRSFSFLSFRMAISKKKKNIYI